MEGFDEAAIFYSDNMSNLGTNDNESVRRNRTDLRAHKNKFKEFLRSFVNGFFNYKYRNILKHNYNIGQYYLNVNLEDLSAFDEELCQSFHQEPDEYLPLFEEAATEVADEVTSPRPADEEELQHIQIMLNSAAEPTNLRDLDSTMVSKIVKVPGIVTSASGIKLKASSITLQCRSCGHVIPKINVKPGLEGFHLPRKCASDQSGQTRCPLDPYIIRTDNCPSWDFQILKLQELPEAIPRGEMPRFLQLYLDRFLCDQVAPGNRVYVVGVYSIKRAKATKRGGGPRDKNVGVRTPYVRVIGIQVDTGNRSNSGTFNQLPENEEEMFQKLASAPNIYERIAKSIAPSIFGMDDVKKAIACLLFGGSRKRLPDGLTRRGDINILLLGDPGMAKSQLLKFVEKVSPIGVYTSGKGSSAAGLTASVIRDPHSRNFVMEGGAMVLADGGIVCIDEFDKMREDDRVSIHEAMEQQTISVAKAGITTTINSRCSVLAAANSVFGRWDDLKGSENINFMPTILSRFDMIFIIKDTHSLERDVTIAKHVMNVHMKAGETTTEQSDGEFSLNLLKKYISFCKTRCGPRLSEAAGEKLKTKYVLIRSESHKNDTGTRSTLNIPITVRQLEAIGRIAESLAKMELQPFVTNAHVDEALRLFQVSTLDAAISGSLAGCDELSSSVDYEKILRIEKLLKKRMPVGVQVSEQTVVSDFVKQKYPECAVKRVIQIMLTRGELVHRAQRKMLYRIR